MSTREIEDLANEFESQIGDIQDGSVELIYAELAALLSEDGTKTNEARYDYLTNRLRRLQEAEASEMEQYFEAHRPLPKGSGTEAIKRADELLAKYENLATSDTASQRAYQKAPST